MTEEKTDRNLGREIDMHKVQDMRRIGVTVLLLALAFGMLMPLAAGAQEPENKTVRVGWYDSSFCYRDAFGRRCGMDYEYQQRISAYTGWTYEYVEDSWSNLLQKLIAGEIDLLSDVSYTEARTEWMLFPELPMGSEAYYIYTASGNRDITAENPGSFNGKRIGVNEGSVQEAFLHDWAEKNGLSITAVPLDVEESESLAMLQRGEIDGYATVFSFSDTENIVPLCRIGASEYFYAVNKNRPDLLAELNMALSGIQDEDPYFNSMISEQRLHTVRTSTFLLPDQKEWLDAHETVRVGYREDCLPFCRTDKESGKLTGALRDYLTHASYSLRNSDLRFTSVPYSTTASALEAMKAGRIDCVFPVSLSSYEAEEMGIRLTNPAMKTGMNALVRSSDSPDLSSDSEISFAVSAGDLNIESFIHDRYPASTTVTYPDLRACLEAVSSGKADCILVSGYRMPGLEEQIKKYKLFSVPTGESMPLSFAVNRDDPDLYFILNKTAVLTRSEDMDNALASYMQVDQKVSFGAFLREHWIAVLLIMSALFAVILVLLLQKMQAERKTNEQQRLLEEAEKIAELKQTISSLLDNMPGMNYTVDTETGTYLACNQAFAEYAHKKSPEEVVGLKQAEIFDPVTAGKFADEDRVALSMDGPYIFFEDVSDAAGNRRQLQTTKLKYIDASGRQCLLGISQDVTDMVRIRRENAMTKEAYEKARSTGLIYNHIAQALARGYADLYYVNLDSEEFIEYRPDGGNGALTEARRGYHFFEECQIEAEEFVHPDDREAFCRAMDRKTLVAALDRNRTFVMTYRLLTEGKPTYVSMKVSRMEDDDRCIIIGVTDVDEEMKQRHAAERMKEEQIAFSRLNALSGDFLCVYVVVPETGHYRQFSSSIGFQAFALPREGGDFFADSRDRIRDIVYSDDRNRFLSAFTRENVMADVGRYGIFTLSYRILMGGKPLYVQLKAAMVEEKEGKRLVVGINDIDAQVRQEEEYVKSLAQARIDANVDALTGVRNRHAYLMAEERLNQQIETNDALAFAIVILDVNDLKTVNDREGHAAGDQYLKNACGIICDYFSHSPVFRIGGDEFAVIVQGRDYLDIDDVIGRMAARNDEALRSGGIVIACGMAKRGDDTSVAPVFERADQNMYENKNRLKAGN